MPLDEVRVGQRGVGYTVMRGVQPEEFQAEILGILRDTFPGVDLIVARLGGLGLERAGVAAGMSGSPVYIDGRIIGAVAYRLVDFGHDAIAGIVPIETMLALGDRESGRGTAPASVAAVLDSASALLRGEGEGRVLIGAGSSAAGVTRIATPLGLTGFDPRIATQLQPLFETFGWAPTAAGTSGLTEQSTPAARPVPGGAVAVQLVRGDIGVTATGTVTYVDGDRVYAFGHPFMQGGDVDFPMVTAEIITVLESQAASQKLSAVGDDVIGAIRQDRLPGVMGVLGSTAVMIPVTIELRGTSGSHTVRFEVVDDPMLTPLYLFFGLVNIVQSMEDTYGAGTIDFDGRIELAGHGDVNLNDLFADRSQAIIRLAGWLSGLFGSVQGNEFGPVVVRGVEAKLQLLEGVRTAEIERLWPTRETVRRGETARLRAVLRSYRGDPIVREIEVPIPANLSPGPVNIVVGSAAAYLGGLSAAGGDGAAPTSLDGLVTLLNDSTRSDRLYVIATRAAAGATVAGVRLPSLPPSALEMVNSGASAADTVGLDSHVIFRGEFDLGRVVAGSASVQIMVERN